MDVLSDVIATMRTGEPRSALARWRAPWGQAYLPVPGAGFQVILQGSCWLIPAEGAPVALGVGDVVFLVNGRGHALADTPSTPVPEPACDPRDHHRRYAPPPEDDGPRDGPGAVTVALCGAYQLDPVRAHPLLADLPEIVHLPARPGRDPEIRAAVELLGGELARPRLGMDALVPALLDMLLLYILRSWFAEQPELGTVTGWAAALNDPAVSAALHAIHREPARPWTVEALGSHAGLSRAAFARRFAEMTGQPPLTYLTWWRMTVAERLLRESDAPLSAVAAQVGYASEFAFANAFKRRYGTAPGRFRRSERA
ncbi:AraC family transcriptional regulator [Planotetraspora thailandica]|uniref:AraC family transcriptional regulator n=1 Tax=Planotetraspora thailandica TaxID=487172 RepID=A0A8J3Y157_9ACTN|nr:AraC family transcriptional regulator [Planotetraspora thailandica]GII58866.1 AraC family transcriptional regulator [Planotetraspora thailandica]